MTTRFAVCVGVVILAMAERASAQDWARQTVNDGFHTELAAAGSYGPIDGYLQTPRGGNPGTTSNHRPTFNELGIDTVASADAALTLGWGNHALVAGGVVTRLSGDSVLNRPLISGNTSYPAGAAVHADVQLDWYRVAYAYRLGFTNRHGATLKLRPEAGLAFFNFDYRLNAMGGPSNSRAYVNAAPELGVQAEWNPGGRFGVSAAVRGAIPEPKNLGILSAQVTGNYRLWGKPARGGDAFVGIGYELIDTEDNQQVPNHIRANMGPLGVLGLRVHF